ncbi:MAG: thioredoxin family protein [Phycisphaerae bacterium]|nr:thioredoxin family protein [Phycisphaerae bacterium]
MRFKTVCAVVAALVAAGVARGQWNASSLGGGFGDSAEPPPMTARLVPQQTHAAPGGRFHVAVDLQIDEGWGYSSHDPGRSEDTGVVPQSADLSVTAEGLEAGRILWPEDEPYGDGTRVYKNRTIVYVPLMVPADAEPGARTIRVTMHGQLCKDVCIPLRGPNAVAAETEIVVADAAADNPAWTDDAAIAQGLTDARPDDGTDDDATTRPVQAVDALSLGALPPVAPPSYPLIVALGGAVLAGLILNVMPCVLPIIPLRIYALVNLAGESRRRYVTLGLAFAGGIVLFFVGVAVANGALKLAAGRALNWSEHWQLPAVRAGLALLVVALAANLLGAFDIAVPSKVAAREGAGGRQGHAGAVGMGLMMAILATPCSAAFVLGILGWAQGQSLWLGTVAILLMGLGMAAPHALLTAFPKLVDKLPKPGRWMELLKQTMGFVLLPLALWLLWTLRAVPRGYGLWVSIYAALLAIGLWIGGRWVRPDVPALRKWGVRLVVAGVLVAAGYGMLSPPAAPDASAAAGTMARSTTQAFGGGGGNATTRQIPQALAGGDGSAATPARIAVARNAGRTVVVKFTADWCLECVVVDRRVYRTEQVKARLAEPDVLYLIGDVTNAGTPAAELLNRIRGAPPLTAIFPPRGDPIYLPGGISRDEFLAALDRAMTGG